MSGRITDFGIGLPEGWHAVPSGPVPADWASALAARVVAGVAVPEGAVEALGEQLLAVKAAVDATGVRGASTAVLVRTPASPFVEAMLTMVLGRGVARETYEEQLDHVAEGVDGAQVMGRQAIEATVPAGAVHGAHLLIGHLPQVQDAAGVHLEERVHVAVFPEGSADMVDVTVVAADVGVFDDLAAHVVGLLDGLEISTEGAA